MINYAKYLFLIFISQSLYSQFSYPLNSGDVWEYWDAYPPPYIPVWTTRAFDDTILPNGKTYTKLRDDGQIAFGFQRKSGSKVFQYEEYSKEERVLYDFSKKKGDTISILYGTLDTVITTVAEDNYSLVFGQPRRVMIFYERGINISMYVLYYVADSIGLVRMTYEPGEGGQLNGAIINGLKYGSVTSVQVNKTTAPEEIMLYQNYPNPFNPMTSIRFRVHQSTKITMKIFNSLGQEIETLADRIYKVGTFVEVWDASQQPSGVYFCRITANNFVDTKSMLLLK